MTKPRYDRARVMRDAHKEWRATRHKPGMTFGKCLATAWAVEKKRAAGREYYNPEPPRIPAHIIAVRSSRARDILHL